MKIQEKLHEKQSKCKELEDQLNTERELSEKKIADLISEHEFAVKEFEKERDEMRENLQERN